MSRGGNWLVTCVNCDITPHTKASVTAKRRKPHRLLNRTTFGDFERSPTPRFKVTLLFDVKSPERRDFRSYLLLSTNSKLHPMKDHSRMPLNDVFSAFQESCYETNS